MTLNILDMDDGSVDQTGIEMPFFDNVFRSISQGLEDMVTGGFGSTTTLNDPFSGGFTETSETLDTYYQISNEDLKDVFTSLKPAVVDALSQSIASGSDSASDPGDLEQIYENFLMGQTHFVMHHTARGYWAVYQGTGDKAKRKTTYSLGDGLNFFGKDIYIFNYPSRKAKSDSNDNTNTTNSTDTVSPESLQQLTQIQATLADLEIQRGIDLDGNGWKGNVSFSNITRALEKLELLDLVDLDGNDAIGTIDDPRKAIYRLEQRLAIDIDGSGSEQHVTLANGLIAPSPRNQDNYRRPNDDQALNNILAQEEYRFGIDLDGNREVGTVIDNQRAVEGLEVARGMDLDKDGEVGTATKTIDGHQRQVINTMSSADGEYHLKFVPTGMDGSQTQLQIVDNAGKVIWQPDVTLAGNGSLVITQYGGLEIVDGQGQTVWQAGTAGESFDELSLRLSDSGLLELYEATTDSVFWSSAEEQKTANWDTTLASATISDDKAFITNLNEEEAAKFLVELSQQQSVTAAAQVLESLSADKAAKIVMAYETEHFPYMDGALSNTISPMSSILQAMSLSQAGAVLTAIAKTRHDVAAHLLWDVIYPSADTKVIPAASPLLLNMSPDTAAATLVALDTIASHGLDLALLKGDSLGVEISRDLLELELHTGQIAVPTVAGYYLYSRLPADTADENLAAYPQASQVSAAIKDPISLYQGTPELALNAMMELDIDTIASLWVDYSATPGTLLPLLLALDPYDVAQVFNTIVATEKTQAVLDLLFEALADSTINGKEQIKEWLLKMLPEWSATTVKAWYEEQSITQTERADLDSLVQDLFSTYSDYNIAVFLSILAPVDSVRLLGQLGDNTLLTEIATHVSVESAAAILDVMDTAEAITRLDSLEKPIAAAILAKMKTAIDVFASLSDSDAAEYLATMASIEAAQLLDQMDAQEGARIVAQLTSEQQRLILSKMVDPQGIKDILGITY